MAILAQEDLKTDDEGELVIERGELVMADAERTAVQLVNFVALTDFGDYLPSPMIGANLVEYMGHPNVRRTHNLMLMNLRDAFRRQGYFDPAVLQIVVEPIGTYEAGIVMKINAAFLVDEETNTRPILGFKFPFPSGKLQRYDVDALTA